MMKMKRRPRTLQPGSPTRPIKLGLSLIAGVLSACALPPAYGPVSNDTGYSETLTDEGYYEVSFRGGPDQARGDVEQLVLRRMAELTLADGGDRLTVLDQSSDCLTEVKVSPTVTCGYRQSTAAMFPYIFSTYEVVGEDPGSITQVYEVTAIMRVGGDEPCSTQAHCYMVADILDGGGE